MNYSDFESGSAHSLLFDDGEWEFASLGEVEEKSGESEADDVRNLIHPDSDMQAHRLFVSEAECFAPPFKGDAGVDCHVGQSNA